MGKFQFPPSRTIGYMLHICMDILLLQVCGQTNILCWLRSRTRKCIKTYKQRKLFLHAHSSRFYVWFPHNFFQCFLVSDQTAIFITKYCFVCDASAGEIEHIEFPSPLQIPHLTKCKSVQLISIESCLWERGPVIAKPNFLNFPRLDIHL